MRSKIRVVLSAFILLTGCADAPVQQQARSYSVMELTTSDMDLQTSYPAAINGKQDIDIYPKISGFIERVCIREGERVRKGQTLFIIEQVQYQAALRTAQANVEAAKAGVSTAQLTYESKQELFARDVISQYDLSLAENQLLTAKAQLAQAEAQEVDARNNLSYTWVTSPADGISGTLPYREGTLVGPNMTRPLTTISDNSSMYVYFSLTENLLLTMLRQYGSSQRALEDMPDIELRLNDGSLYNQPGRIETISGVIESSTGAVSIRAVFPNPDGLLRSGGSGNVVLPVRYQNSLVIPQHATIEIQDKIFAYKVSDGKAVQTMISVSKDSNGQDYIVLEGLEPGDVIVTEGVGMLRDGAPIEIKTEGEV